MVVLHEPLVGYANNGDFARVAAWFDVWPRLEGVNPAHAYPSAPIAAWHVDATVAAPADYVTTEIAVVGAWLALPRWASRAADGAGDTIELWRLGLWRVALLAIAAAVVAAVLHRVSATAGLVAAAAFAIVLCDPMTTLYLNTMYSEFSLAVSGFVVVALSIALIALGPDRPLLGAGLVLASMALGWSKIQFFALPLVVAGLVVVAAVAFHRRTLRSPLGIAVLATLLATAAATAVLQKGRIDHGGGYMAAARMCNATDAYFGTFLPRSSDPGAGVRALGLPERCRAYVGKLWFDPGMDPPPCPELFDVPRLGGLARLVALEPALALRLISDGLPLTRPFVHPRLGHVAGVERGRLAFEGRFASLATWFDRLSARAYVGIFAIAALGWCVALVRLGLAARRREPARRLLLELLVVVVGTVVAYALASSIAGDGFADLAKHFFLGQLGLAVLLPASVAVLARAA